MSPLKAIRHHCLECVGTPNEVRNCQITNCNLYDYRFGKNPNRKPRNLTEEQKEALRERMKLARESK